MSKQTKQIKCECGEPAKFITKDAKVTHYFDLDGNIIGKEDLSFDASPPKYICDNCARNDDEYQFHPIFPKTLASIYP